MSYLVFSYKQNSENIIHNYLGWKAWTFGKYSVGFYQFLQHESNTSILLLSLFWVKKSVLQLEGNPCRWLLEFSSYSETARVVLHRTLLLLNAFSNQWIQSFVAVLVLQHLQAQDVQNMLFQMGTQIRCRMIICFFIWKEKHIMGNCKIQ